MQCMCSLWKLELLRRRQHERDASRHTHALSGLGLSNKAAIQDSEK